MAEIKPFKALRFSENAGIINELVCPPYDIISEEERLAFINTNKNNIIRLELPREGEDVYKTAGEVLNSWLENNILTTEDEESYYIYEEEFKVEDKTYSLKGLITRVKVTDFEEGVVIPHENTLSAAKEDRFNLMCATGCNFSQVYCLFEDPDKKVSNSFEDISKTGALHNFTDKDGVTHRLWKAGKEANLDKLFTDKKLFIADGHHRYETAIRYRNYMRQKGADVNSASEYVMMMLVPMECEGLVVFPTHRVVHSVENFDGRSMMIAAREYFHVGEMSTLTALEKNLKNEYSSGRISFGAYIGGRYFLLTLKHSPALEELLPDVNKELRNLDVTVLHSLILEQILNIDKENMAKQINLTYTRDSGEAIELVNNGANCAFLLNPTRVEQIAKVGNAGEKMPQKSTYFYPKLITGLVMNKF